MKWFSVSETNKILERGEFLEASLAIPMAKYEVYWSIVHFLLGNALGDQISDAWFLPFLVSDGESLN